MAEKGRPYYGVFMSYETGTVKGFIPKRPSRIKNFRQGNEPGFKCPGCGHSFKLKYGVFGKMRTFEDNTNYCLECSEKRSFIKSDK